MDKTAPLSRLFQACYGTVPETIVPLAGAGSNRAYYRLQAGTETCIGVRGTSAEENRAFLYLARHLRSKGLPVPQVCIGGADDCRAAGLGDDDCELYYLQEDLGDCSLYQVLQQSRTPGGDYPPGTVCLLRRVIALLPRLQYEGARGLDFGRCFPQPMTPIFVSPLSTVPWKAVWGLRRLTRIVACAPAASRENQTGTPRRVRPS